MTQDSSQPQTFHLVALRDVDHKREELRRLIEAGPKVLAARAQGIRDAEARLAAAAEKLQGFRARLKTLELELSQTETALEKARANLLAAKSNQEYSLLEEEIARREEERGEAETRILEQYDVIKTGEAQVEEATAGVAAAKEEYAAFVARSEAESKEHEAELASLDERREEIRRALPADTLVIYDRAFRGRGDAVVASEDGICKGCFSKLTKNDTVRLKAASELVVCPACQRILYLPEQLQARA